MDADLALKVRDVLPSTQRLTPAAMVDYPARPLDKLVRHAARNVPFYGNRLEPLASGEVTAKAWAALPPTGRAKVRDDFAGLSARTLPPGAGRNRTIAARATAPLPHLPDRASRLTRAGDSG